MDDDIRFQINDVSRIMDEMEYPGIRITMDVIMGKMVTPIKIDISTGDIITPRAIEYSYKLMLEDRSINLWSYNLETILAEKLQTILARGILNTRIGNDYYEFDLSSYGAYCKGPNVFLFGSEVPVDPQEVVTGPKQIIIGDWQPIS